MTAHFDAIDDARTGDGRADPPDATPPVLDATVVRYDDQPDRTTVYPRDATRDERMAAWLTADAAAFVALVDAR